MWSEPTWPRSPTATPICTPPGPLTVQPFLKQKPPTTRKGHQAARHHLECADVAAREPDRARARFEGVHRSGPTSGNTGSALRVGNDYHLLFELLKAQAQIDIAHIPYGHGARDDQLLTDQIHLLLTSVARTALCADSRARVLAVIARSAAGTAGHSNDRRGRISQSHMVPWFGRSRRHCAGNVVAAWDKHTRDLQQSQGRESSGAEVRTRDRTLSEFDTVIERAGPLLDRAGAPTARSRECRRSRPIQFSTTSPNPAVAACCTISVEPKAPAPPEATPPWPRRCGRRTVRAAD